MDSNAAFAARARLKTLGLVFMGLGFIELAWVAFCVFGGLFLGVGGLLGLGDDEMLVVVGLSGVYVVLAAVNAVIAALHLWTGRALRQGRGMLLLLASIAACVMNFVFALYCFPFTAIAVVFAFVTLLDADARAVLDQD